MGISRFFRRVVAGKVNVSYGRPHLRFSNRTSFRRCIEGRIEQAHLSNITDYAKSETIRLDAVPKHELIWDLHEFMNYPKTFWKLRTYNLRW